MFIGKIYKLGKSGRLAVMLPKDVVLEPGEYNIEITPKEEISDSAIADVPETSDTTLITRVELFDRTTGALKLSYPVQGEKAIEEAKENAERRGYRINII